jgi:glycosyltransferase involved in cell wall biosynthesis
VLTSPKEGWGISNLEAAACGTATVASDSPGLRDSVRHGETGYLVPHGDVDALAARLADILGTRRCATGSVRCASLRGVLCLGRAADETEAHLAGVLAARGD